MLKDKQKTQQLVNQRNLINVLRKQNKNNNENVIDYQDYINEVEHYKTKLAEQEQQLLNYQQQAQLSQLKNFIDVGKKYNINSEQEFYNVSNELEQLYGINILENPSQQALNLFETHLSTNQQIINSTPLKSSNINSFKDSKTKKEIYWVFRNNK